MLRTTYAPGTKAQLFRIPQLERTKTTMTMTHESPTPAPSTDSVPTRPWRMPAVVARNYGTGEVAELTQLDVPVLAANLSREQPCVRTGAALA